MCVLKRLGRLEVGTHIKNRVLKESFAFIIVVSRNVVSVSDTSAVNFIVGWWLFACSMNCNISSLFLIQSENMSSIYRFQTSGRNALWLIISVSTLLMKMLANATAIFVPMAVPCIWR